MAKGEEVKTRKSRKIVRICLAVIALVLISQSACVQAEWARSRIKPGMSVGDVFRAIDGWDWCVAYSPNTPPEKFVSYHLTHSQNQYFMQTGYQGARQQFTGKDELIPAMQKLMNDGHPWRMSFTYLGGLRASFAVSLDLRGRVETVSGIAGPA